MVAEADEVIFNRMSYVHEVNREKDKSHDTKLIWNRMTQHLCTSPRCTLRFCFCNARKPENVSDPILAAYLKEIKNIPQFSDADLEV